MAGYAGYGWLWPDASVCRSPVCCLLQTFLIDLGAEAARGLECGGWMVGCVGAYGTRISGPSEEACDGIHPRGGTNFTARHGELGAMLAVQAALALASSSPS